MVDFTKPKIHFFNTETKRKELFEPHKKGTVRMYTCGPTIYHYAHIGNFRTYIFEDILRRTLKSFGYQVTQAMNITDIDDKTIRGAMKEGLTLKEYTRIYENAFFVDIQELGIEKVEFYPHATDYIKQMIDFIEELLFKEYAYKSKDQSIYFSIDKWPKYGRLCHLKFDELKVGVSDARIVEDEYDKENAGDFVLWKSYDEKRDGEIFWDSPFGRGRPGWHLECSTMAIELLGNELDIHCGGVDNIFPHHENEIAQSEAFSGHHFVKYWLHAEHLLVDNKKMSKSLGNFYTLRDLMDKGYNGTEVRYMLMHTHYRTQLNFTSDGMEGARSALKRINDFVQKMIEIANGAGEKTEEVEKILQYSANEFYKAMGDDLNISVALAALFDLIYQINVLYDQGLVSPSDARSVIVVLEEFNQILNVISFSRLEDIPSHVYELLEQREDARKKKDWKRSDHLRDEIIKQGYVIEDTPKGPRLKVGTSQHASRK